MDIRREVLRNVVLCQSLPLGIRPGRPTSAPEPATPAENVERFLVAGVNSSWPFYDLADRVLEAGHQPDCIFDIAYEAQNASHRNLAGDKVNEAPIYLLVPLVAAQMLQYLERGTREDVEAILARTGDVLRATTETDVEFLERFLHLGGEIPGYPVLQGNYANVWEVVRDYQTIHTVREMMEGYPRSQQVYRFLLDHQETGLLPAIELIYDLLLPQVGEPGPAIDIVVIGLYLLLTRHPESLLSV